MTTTHPPTPAPASPPGPPAPPDPGAAPGPSRSTTSGPWGRLLGAEVALAATTAAAIFGFGRIFDSWSFLAPLLVVALAGHVTAAVCRRRGLGLPTTALLSAIAWALVVTWLFFVDTTLALLPTPDTLSTARQELERSWDAFHEIVAPAPVQTGFLLAAAVAIAGAAFLADWAAFRLWSAREALIPCLTLFVFATLLADDRYRAVSAVLMVAAVLVFVLAHRVVAMERSHGWVSSGRARAGRSMLLAGAVLAAASVVVGALVAPHLPGVDEAPLVDWRDGDDASSARMLESPIVDLRRRLVDTSDRPMFTVESESPSYWRIAALEQFDGTQWRFHADTDQVATGRLGTLDGPPRQGRQTQQRYTFQQLQTPFLPAAFRPLQLQAPDDALVRYDIETATLIADDPTSEGVSYVVTSMLPDVTPDELRTATRFVPEEVQVALELPEDFSPTARRIAEEETAGARTRYDQALALQEFFRDPARGGFTYSTDVSTGQGSDAIETFLEDRIGYCEQYSAAFAAMARSLDIPARVAVGYTWGQEDPSSPGTYEVLGRNSHAWPEVYLGEYGWIPFEPTPGRGNPDAESYTGVPGTQEDASGEVATTTTTAPETSSTTTSTVLAPEQVEGAAAPTSSGSSDSGTNLLLGVAIVVIAALLYAVAVPGSLALRRRRRRARASGSPGAEVGVAWSEATESLALAGVRSRPDETHAELAARATVVVPAAGEALHRLAAAADASAFGPASASADSAAAEDAARQVRSAVEAQLRPLERLRGLLDPRPLWAGRRHRHRAS